MTNSWFSVNPDEIRELSASEVSVSSGTNTSQSASQLSCQRAKVILSKSGDSLVADLLSAVDLQKFATWRKGGMADDHPWFEISVQASNREDDDPGTITL